MTDKPTDECAHKIIECLKTLRSFNVCKQQVEEIRAGGHAPGHAIDDAYIAILAQNFEEVLKRSNKPAFNFNDWEMALINHVCEKAGIDLNAPEFKTINMPSHMGGFHWFDVGEIRNIALEFRAGGHVR